MADVVPATISRCPRAANKPPAAAAGVPGSGSRTRPTLAPLRMCGFAPRPFPPPELAGVPAAYVHEQLRRLAHAYWGNTDSADCTLIIPTKLGAMPARAADRASRRVTEPALPSAPPLVLRLHTDYLAAHSTLLRALFAGASALDLITSASTGPAPPSAALLPRALPSSTAADVQLFLPLPDPASFRFLAHWCYFRDFRFIADYLARGLLSWAGVAQNVRYLGMPAELKDDLARYYQAHLAHDALVSPVSSVGSDGDGEWSGSEDTDVEMDVDEGAKPCAPRGRATTIRPAFPYPPVLPQAA